MDRNRMLVLRIAGSAAGVLVLGVASGVALAFILSPFDPEEGSSGEGLFQFIFGALGGLALGTVGAALGATITQKLLGLMSSFWRALLGAVVGLVGGALCVALIAAANTILPNTFEGPAFAVSPIVVLAAIVAGAVIGSGWKAKPRDAASPPG